MDKVEKALSNLSPRERESIKRILLQLDRGDLAELQITKPTGRKDLFSVRKGNVRIIFRRSNGGIFVLKVERPRERTYEGL